MNSHCVVILCIRLKCGSTMCGKIQIEVITDQA